MQLSQGSPAAAGGPPLWSAACPEPVEGQPSCRLYGLNPTDQFPVFRDSPINSSSCLPAAGGSASDQVRGWDSAGVDRKCAKDLNSKNMARAIAEPIIFFASSFACLFASLLPYFITSFLLFSPLACHERSRRAPRHFPHILRPKPRKACPRHHPLPKKKIGHTLRGEYARF